MKHIDVEDNTHAELMGLKYMLKKHDVSEVVQFLIDEWRSWSRTKKKKMDDSDLVDPTFRKEYKRMKKREA